MLDGKAVGSIDSIEKTPLRSITECSLLEEVSLDELELGVSCQKIVGIARNGYHHRNEQQLRRFQRDKN